MMLFLLSHTSLGAAVEDHLVPRWPHDELPNYYALLQQKVMVTPADFGRFVVIPSPASLGEESVAIWSAGSRFRVTYTKASRNIWYATMWPKDPEYGLKHHGAVTVSRIDVDISAATAFAVRDAWAKMLRGTAPRRRGGTEQVILDGTDFEFFLRDRTYTMIGTATHGLTGKNTSELIRVGNLLIDYCRSDAVRQARIAQEIQNRASNLSSRVGALLPMGLTNHWSEPLAVLLSGFDSVREFLMFASLALATGRSVRSR